MSRMCCTELRQARQEALGMPSLMAVNAAVQRLQVHRGTSAAMLGGDSAMAARRPAIARCREPAFEPGPGRAA